MPLLKDYLEQKKFDLRIQELNVRRGSVSAEDLEANLSKLQDDAVNANWTQSETLNQGSAPHSKN